MLQIDVELGEVVVEAGKGDVEVVVIDVVAFVIIVDVN
jgi:hypothetical protein